MRYQPAIHLLECGVYLRKLFQETLVFAHESGANFNGVLCGRATWAGSVKDYIEQGEAARMKRRTKTKLRLAKPSYGRRYL